MTPARSVVIILALGHCLLMIDRNLLAVAATPVARALSLRDGMLGLVLGTAFAVPYAVAALGFGRLADFRGTRALLVGGALVWTVASLLTGLTQTPGELVAARMSLAIGQAAFVPAALAMLTRGADAPGRLALFTGGSTLGRSLALLAGGAILGVLTVRGANWRALFVVTAAPNLLFIVTLLVMRLPRAEPLAHSPSAAPPARLLFLAAACAPIVVGQAAIAWMPSLLVRLHALTPARAGMLAGAVALIAAPAGQLLGGWLARHWKVARERPLLVVVIGLWSAVPALLLIAADGSLVLAAIGLALVNLTLGVASFAAIHGWQQLWPAGERGLGNGTFMATVTLVGLGAGPLLAGLTSEAAGGGGAALAHGLLVTSIVAASSATLAAFMLARAIAIPGAVAA